MQEMQVRSLGWEDPLEKEMVTHYTILPWEIPWTEEPGRLHTVHGVTRVGHNLVIKQPSLITTAPPITSTADGDCSLEIQRCLLLGRKALTNLEVK